MSTQRIFFVSLLGLLLFLTGCGGGKSGPAKVWVDNCTSKPCAVSIDGEDRGTLEPYANLQLELTPGKHTFVLTCEGQAAETIEANILRGKTTLVRPAAAESYSIFTCSKERRISKAPAEKTGAISADYGPLDGFPEALSAAQTRVVRSLPENPDLAELEYFISGEYEYYGISSDAEHSTVAIERLQRLASRKDEPAVGQFLIRVLDELAVCASGNSDVVAISDAALALLEAHHGDIADDKLLSWLGIDVKTGKARTLEGDQCVNPSIAAVAAALLLKRGKHQQVADHFAVLSPEAAHAVLVDSAKANTSEELRRTILLAGLRRTEGVVLKEACKIMEDESFSPSEDVAEALASGLESLDLSDKDDRPVIAYCAGLLVRAYYRNPAIVARPKAREFLVKYAQSHLDPIQEQALHALIMGQCANDIVPIYTNYTLEERIGLIEKTLKTCQERKYMTPDIIELIRKSGEDEDTEVRRRAAKALSELFAFKTDENLPEFEDLAVRALGDPSWVVQREAAKILTADGFPPSEMIVDQIVEAWRMLDGSDPEGKANREYLVELLKANFKKHPGTEEWRQRALGVFAKEE